MRRCLSLGIMMLAAQWCVAASFHLPRLQKMAESVHLQINDSILTPDVELDSVAFYMDKVLYIRTDGFGDVSHLGYRLFPQFVRANYKGFPIFDFLERYLLELDLRLDGKDAALRMDIDQVVVFKGSLQMLHQLKNCSAINVDIEEIARKMYRFKLQMDGNELVVVIPADNQLLFGGNLRELEQSFISGVNRMITIEAESLIQNWDAALVKSRKDEMVIDGGYYRIKEIRGDIYLTFRKGHRQLLMDRKSPIHSVSNMMLTGIVPQNVPLQLDFHVYGNKIDRQQVSLQQFVDYCKNEGCKLYFGAKKLTDTELTGTLFAYNEKFAYTHMLTASIPLNILEGGLSPIKGQAYIYIPLHDITENYIGNISK